MDKNTFMALTVRKGRCRNYCFQITETVEHSGDDWKHGRNGAIIIRFIVFPFFRKKLMKMTKLPSYIDIKNFFYPQASFGISANAFLLLSHIFTLVFTHRVKPTDMTVSHLSLKHILLLFTRAILVSSDLFRSRNIQNDVRCKAVVLLSKVLRGLCICTCTTCLLSALQAITISPSSSSLAKLKHISPNHTLGFFLFSWVLNVSISSHLLLYTVATSNGSEASLLFIMKHCSFLPMSYMHRSMFSTLTTLRDVTFIGFMVLSSGYMVIILYRHKRLSQHLHGTSPFPRVSPVKRASQTILLLVSCFVFLYWVDFTFSFSVLVTWINDPLLVWFQIIVVNSYATISPLVLIHADKRIFKIVQTLWWKKK
ncbi:hypothetical protein HPG69_008138 [Diceros bicornis minor]|uniref:Vomeronasal type-1 receptor n=1 Tax=Diceros bicornis minor TaxID=77932 RepID=A0A7J7F6W2_DICBM|nr:hypothetical protein HPG69_008138 [Diceros bicornis minor]